MLHQKPTVKRWLADEDVELDEPDQRVINKLSSDNLDIVKDSVGTNTMCEVFKYFQILNLVQVPGTYFSRSFRKNNSSVLQHQSHNRIKTARNSTHTKTQCVWLDLDCSHVQKVNSVQPVSVGGQKSQNVLDVPKSTVNVCSPSEAVASEIDYQISDFVF